jgi:hypothetical protein
MATQADKDEFRRQYPQYGWLFDNGEIGPLLERSISEGWPEGRLTGEIMQTTWWKQTVPSQRTYLQQLHDDPAKVDEQIRGILPDLWDTWISLGMPAPAADDPFMLEMANNVLKFGWNPQQTKDALVSRITFDKNNATPVGSIGTTMNQIKQSAQMYFIQLDDETAFRLARQVAAGEHAVTDFDIDWKNQAKSRFPSLTKQIDQGWTPADYFKPYQTAIAQTLETSPQAIDLMSSKWSALVDFHDEKTGENRPMTQNEALVYARKQDEFKSTRNAQESAADMGNKLLEMFGKKA